jgi:flavin reductase (DIM6/NTAB) family NADH-FMN oxidoreductase RutF
LTQRKELDFWSCTGEILHRFNRGGVLCSVIDKAGRPNLITLGWGQIGPSYHGHPVLTIAVTPDRYSWRALEDVPEFTIAVPDDGLARAVAYCGSKSGRDVNKFKKANLTPVPGHLVRSFAVLECPINLECKIYTRVHPPHLLLTPEHRERPLEHQHTIYFAEVLSTYGWTLDKDN